MLILELRVGINNEQSIINFLRANLNLEVMKKTTKLIGASHYLKINTNKNSHFDTAHVREYEFVVIYIKVEESYSYILPYLSIEVQIIISGSK
jgi:hypothetical protein